MARMTTELGLADATLFVHMSDLHFVTLGALANGIDSLANARNVLQRIRGLSTPPAFMSLMRSSTS